MKIKQKLKIKGVNTPVFIKGEENGVIATQIIEIPDDFTPMDISGMLDSQRKLINETVEVISEEIK